MSTIFTSHADDSAVIFFSSSDDNDDVIDLTKKRKQKRRNPFQYVTGLFNHLTSSTIQIF